MAAPHSPFSDEEIELAKQVPMTKAILLHSQRIGTAALGRFALTVMEPVVATVMGLSDRDRAVCMTFYRISGALRTLADLREGYQFQTIAATTRLLLELAIDIELLTSDRTSESAERFHGFTRAARFSAARTFVRFYTDHPQLPYPRDAQAQRDLVSDDAREAEITELCQKLWDQNGPPNHWSGLRWSEQSARVSLPLQAHYVRWQSFFAWQIHGGGAGVADLSAEALQAIEVLCREVVRGILPDTFRRIGVELYMHRAIPDFFDQLEFARHWSEVFASVDAALQTLGRPSKFAA
jgi:hypothetical protein